MSNYSTALALPTNPSTTEGLQYSKALLVFCPTGAYCREDRCQSFFNFELIPSMRAPLEECEIAGAFKKVGLRHALIDGPAENLTDAQFLGRVQRENPDLLVAAVTFGSFEQDLKWVRKLKEVFPRCHIGIRGTPCYVWDKKLLTSEPALDFCVRGDYEIVFEDIARKGLPRAAGVTYRDSQGVIQSNAPYFAQDLDSLPHPDRSAIHQALYTVRGSGRPQATIRVQRGCPFPCSYCLVHTVSGKKARHRSPQSIATEMEDLLRIGTKHFYLRADTFSVNKRWTLEVCRELAQRCPGARWVTTTRVECVDDEIVSAMKTAGCYGISFGVDVASEIIGAKVRKPPRLKDATSAMRICDTHGVISLAYFMIGFIWETEQTLAETEQFIRKIKPDLITIHFAHPYPGTDYYEAVQIEGAQVISLRAQAEPALSLPHLTSATLKKEARRMLLKHYRRPSVWWSLARKGACLIF